MSFIPGVSLRDMLKVREDKMKYIDDNETTIGTVPRYFTVEIIKKHKNGILGKGNDFIEKLYAQLQTIHSKGVLLEDIKYGNIMITKDSELFFIDFHSARVIPAVLRKKMECWFKKEIRRFNELFEVD